ncbi:class I SAM-dependent RNA methyltransferase [Nocardia macrotermitis]|uniref:23S rRNA (Uracil(1939)-C(5))-methyltransferase RlmD n=1 Tax=Nocardia macrotermitis TaxID=2585198 RepID=A0A7K0CVP0_9NOCA|nr:TRAM domain-containing protein [Nocardia macrotermitis]MQY17567.1 23S rRNA (uracil(1939)-C(5))-methyltransferase RlmD [Nocardia macrotermitis]
MSGRGESGWAGQVFEVTLGAPGHGGFCVARHEGRVLFVRHGLPGEVVRALVTEDRGGSFCRAEAVEILEASADRVAATCPVSGPGGAGCCDFSFATAAAQRELKAAVVREQLRRVAGWETEVEVEAIPGGEVAGGGWRTRIRLAVDQQGRAGVHGFRSAGIIADLRCPQPVSGAMDGIAERSWTPGADLVVAVDGDGVRHIVEIAPAEIAHDRGAAGSADRFGDRRGGRADGGGRTDGKGGARGGGRADRGWRADGGDGGGERRRRGAAARRAAAHAPRRERVVEGTGRAVQYVAGRRWEVSATAFWQPHRGAAQCYSDIVAEWSELSPGLRAWDLYCGAGVFAARIGSSAGVSGAVFGVESARGAVADGAAALADMPWVSLDPQRVERWLDDGITRATPDVVVLDPPRAGAGKAVITPLAAAEPARIVHIGCDPAAFARDISLYRANGYAPTRLRAFDAFPATHHVECLALLEPIRA